MNGKKTVTIITLLMFLITMPFYGCGKKGAKKPFLGGGKQKQQQQQKTVIGVSLANAKDETSQAIKQGMQMSAKNEKDIQLKFSDATNDSMKQEEDVDKLIQQKPKVIVIQAVDPELSRDLVRRIMQKKIKVIAVDKMPKDVALDGYVAADYTRAGQMAGDYAARQMVGKPAGAVLLQGDATDPQTQSVSAGVSQGLGGMQTQTISVPRSDSELATTNLNTALKNGGIGAIIATNSQLATVASSAVKSQGKTGKLVVIGIGGGTMASQAIKSGDMTAVVDTQPMMVGQTAFKAASDLAKTQRWEFERHIMSNSSDIPAKLIPVRLVTKDNLYLLQESSGGGQSGGGGKSSSGSGKKKEKKQGQSSGSGGSGGGSSGGSGGSSGSSSGSGSGGSSGGSQGGQGTIVKITTEDGKTMELNVKGKIKKIEYNDGSSSGGGGSESGGSGSGSSGGSGGGGGGQ